MTIGLLKLLMRSCSKDNAANRQVGDFTTSFIDLEDARITGDKREVRCRQQVKLGARADERQQGASADFPWLERSS